MAGFQRVDPCPKSCRRASRLACKCEIIASSYRLGFRRQGLKPVENALKLFDLPNCTASVYVTRPNKPAEPTIISYVIDTDGGVKDVAVTQSSGDEPRDAAIASCVARWRFKPATKDGVAVAVERKLEVNWSVRR